MTNYYNALPSRTGGRIHEIFFCTSPNISLDGMGISYLDTYTSKVPRPKNIDKFERYCLINASM